MCPQEYWGKLRLGLGVTKMQGRVRQREAEALQQQTEVDPQES